VTGETPTLRCPFCASEEIEQVSQWGGQLITAQMRCRACNTHFEAVRDEGPPGMPNSPPRGLVSG
jgi:hypothetical protein